MVYRRTLILTDEQRQQLIYHRDHDPRPYVRERCAALLKIAEGQSPHAVARRGLLKPRDPDTIYEWLNSYERTGFWSVEQLRHGGNHRKKPKSSQMDFEMKYPAPAVKTRKLNAGNPQPDEIRLRLD